jgi:hypothetical protein
LNACNADNIQSIPGQLFNSRNTKGFLNLVFKISFGGRGWSRGPALIIIQPCINLAIDLWPRKPVRRLHQHNNYSFELLFNKAIECCGL